MASLAEAAVAAMAEAAAEDMEAVAASLAAMTVVVTAEAAALVGSEMCHVQWNVHVHGMALSDIETSGLELSWLC